MIQESDEEESYDRGNPLAAELEREAVNEYRDQARRQLDNFLNPALMLIQSSSNIQFAFHCFLLATGKFDILGYSTQVELADAYKCERENVRKLVDKFQKRLGIPPMPGQRGADGRKNMSNTRKAQLK